jgi:hypothetical protein
MGEYPGGSMTDLVICCWVEGEGNRVLLSCRSHTLVLRPLVLRPLVLRPLVLRPLVLRPLVLRSLVLRPLVLRPPYSARSSQ